MNFQKISAFELFLVLKAINFQQTFAIFLTNAKFNNSNFFGPSSLDARFESPRGHELLTRFDIFRGQSRLMREWTFAKFNREKSFRKNVRLGRIQPQISADTHFPCDLRFARSVKPPTSIHKLRPGDIDIIAAIGDSISAGTCLMTESYFEFLYENRGLTFSGGGYGDWRQFLTLPNILKVFNPNLYGYAIADGFTFHSTSRLNVAEPTALSRDLIHQTKLLIQRLRQDPNVDMENHWKLLTIFVGNVDLCVDLCLHDDITLPLRYHEQDLRQSLTLLRDTVPRLFVNLLPASNMIETLRKMKLSPPCYVIHRTFCSCITDLNESTEDFRAYEEKIQRWQEVDAQIANLAEFNTEEFTVVFHPFLTFSKPELTANGEVDLRYFGADCFHLSQLTHASFANTLWNSMMQPIGHKEHKSVKPFERFECPSKEQPYLATNGNSFS